MLTELFSMSSFLKQIYAYFYSSFQPCYQLVYTILYSCQVIENKKYYIIAHNH